MRIIIYSKIVEKVSGVQTFEKVFLKRMSKHHELIYVYEAGSIERIEEFKKWVKVVQNNGQVIEGDVCIYSSVYHGAHQIKARKYIQICHADFQFWNIPYSSFSIDTHVAVGPGVARSLKDHYNIDAVVIPNMLDEVLPNPAIRLLTASRIREHKGFERMILLARKLKESKRSFVWEIYGDGPRSYIDKLKYDLGKADLINDFIFMGSRLNIQDYMVKADYIVQLSDNEGFCYSMYEALQIGKPVIVSRFEGVEETIIDGINGYILDMDLSNLDIDRLYNSIPQNVKLDEANSEKTWLALLGES